MNDLERDLRQMYARREADLREPRFAPAHAPAPILRRTRHRQVAVALTTIAVVAAVAIGSTAGAVALLRSSDRRMPANPSETPTPTLPVGGLIPSPDLGVVDVNVAWGEVDGVAWNIWANEDLSCLTFAVGDRHGIAGEGADGGCGDGYDGTDLMLPVTCWACPVMRQSILYGLVSSRVAGVELVVDDGSRYVGMIHPSPPDVTVDASVFTVPTFETVFNFTGTLTAVGADGEILGQVRYPWNADAAGGVSMPISIETTLASGAPVSEVDGRTSEADRWEIAVWRNAAGDWCLGTIFPNAPQAVVATEGQECGPREDLFQGIRRGAIGHADVWSIDEASMFGEQAKWFRYRAVGTVSTDVAAVRIELGDGQTINAEMYDPPPSFEDMGRLFVAEFRSRDHPWEYGGSGGITWRAIALNANSEVLGSDEISL